MGKVSLQWHFKWYLKHEERFMSVLGMIKREFECFELLQKRTQ
jgi:hypothetical protein